MAALYSGWSMPVKSYVKWKYLAHSSVILCEHLLVKVLLLSNYPHKCPCEIAEELISHVEQWQMYPFDMRLTGLTGLVSLYHIYHITPTPYCLHKLPTTRLKIIT